MVRVNLPQGMGWEDWQVVRDQHAHRAMVKVFVRKGETPATAKVRVMVAQTPKPTFDSPQAIVDATRADGESSVSRKPAQTRFARAPMI